MQSSPAAIFTVLARLTISVVVLLSVAAPLAAAGEAAGGETAEATQKETGPFPILPSDSDPARFDFETELMRGTIRLEGAYHGVTRLVDKATGRQVIDERYSALNLFRLMSVNRVLGVPRHRDRTTKSAPNWVEATWPPSETHKGEITARYEVAGPQAIDLTVTVESQGTYAGYELFLSNYFDRALTPHVYLQPVRGSQQTDGGLVQPIVPTVNDVFRGTLLVFPRDAHVARLALDGRWDRSVIQLCPVRHYAHCLAVLADAERKLGVVLMSHPQDCYALSTRYHAEQDEDRLTTYSAFDFSLFGNDLLPGHRRVVKVRLALTELDESLSQPLELYRTFVSERDTKRDSANPQRGAQ